MVDAVACMSTKSSPVGKEQWMMDKQRLRKERNMGYFLEEKKKAVF